MGLTRPTAAQINTVVTTINDPITVLNQGSTLANIDVGFIINRNGGALANTAIFWNESANTFVTAFTTTTGATNANISISEYANLRVNTLTADTATFSSTGAIKIPSGNTAQRTAGTTGQIRFNTSTSQFEGYQGASWSSLGGVRSVDNNTYIIAESSAGAGDNILQFFAGGNRQANLSSAGLTVTANVSAGYFTGNGSQLSGINSFSNVFISGQSPVQADSISDTLTLVSGTGIAITTDTANDSITFSSVSTTGPFAASGDFGAVNDPVTVSEDEGSVADGATITYDLGSIISASGLIYPDQLVLPSYTVSTLPSATVAAQLVYNTTANGLAFSDGINWSNIGASYSNVQVASYLATNPPTGTYSNVQVATYLPTHTGTVSTSLINSSGNVLATGLSVFGNTRIGSLATPGALHTIIGNVDVSGAGTEYFNIGGNIMAITATLSSLTINGSANVTGFSNISISSGSADSALQIVGNVARGGASYHDFLRVTSTASGATNVNKHFRLDGTGNLQIINSAYSSTILSLTDAGILSDGKGDVRSAPQNSQGGAYTLVVGDAGKHISITTGGVTVNASIFSIGDMITIFNNSGSSQNITQGASVTLRLAGTATTGTRALAQYGVATLLCVTGGATPTFACAGAGLT